MLNEIQTDLVVSTFNQVSMVPRKSHAFLIYYTEKQKRKGLCQTLYVVLEPTNEV